VSTPRSVQDGGSADIVKDKKSFPWLKIDPRTRAKLDAVEWDSQGVWFACQIWSADNGTEGLVPRSKMAAVVARRLPQKRIDRAIAELVADGLLEDRGDMLAPIPWEQPPVEVWQDDVLLFRHTRNTRFRRMNDLKDFVRHRDRNLCRYCGVRVHWSNDHRGRQAGTFDHVDPDGDNTRENVVVACNGCNGIKKDRTPEQAKMSLYRPGTTSEQIARMAASPQAASSMPRPVPEPRARGGDRDPIAIRSGSDRDHGPGPPRARPRALHDPDLTGSEPDPGPTGQTGGSVASVDGVEGDGSVPRLLQGSGGVVRLRPEDPGFPGNGGG
jgi:hypothetical protein